MGRSAACPASQGLSSICVNRKKMGFKLAGDLLGHSKSLDFFFTDQISERNQRVSLLHVSVLINDRDYSTQIGCMELHGTGLQ